MTNCERVNLNVLDQGLLDPKIANIIECPQDVYNQMWQTVEFCRAFPKVVQTLISPVTSPQFSPMQREAVFIKTMASFANLSWDDKTASSIPTKSLVFKRDGEIVSWRGREFGNQANPLMYAEIAYALLLGMSLPNQDIVRENITNLHESLTKSRQETFKYCLGRLADLKNATRTWIKTNELDLQAGLEWDEWTVEMLLGLPEYSIDRAKDMPIPDIPAECTYVLKDRFSKEAVTVFLKYLWHYSQTFSLTDDKFKIIVNFMHDLRGFGSDFLRSERIMPMFSDLEKLVNLHYDVSSDEEVF